MLLPLIPREGYESKPNLTTLISSTSELFPMSKSDITISVSEIFNFYTDCDSKNYSGKKPVPRKSMNEIIYGVRKRQLYERTWTKYFNNKLSESPLSMKDIDTSTSWSRIIQSNEKFENSFNYQRIRGGRWVEKHKAIDLFTKKGAQINSPISGIVIASGDDWKGSLTKRKGMNYRGGGLGELTGNGVVIFSPLDTSYLLMAHLNEVYVKTGDVISRQDAIGTVGNTGNAIYPWIPYHLHFAYKKPETQCGIKDVLVSKNPYWKLKQSENSHKRK